MFRKIIFFPLSRTFNKKIDPPTPAHLQSHARRYQMSVDRKLVKLLKENDKQNCDLLLDHEFYSRMGDSNNLQSILEWKNSVAFYFRDYPSLLMNLENEGVLMGKGADFQRISVRKILLFILSDHEALARTVGKFWKSDRSRTVLSIYIKCLSQLILGSFVESEKELLKIINATDQVAQSSPILLDKKQPKSLNMKQQILFNLLIFRMYKNSDGGKFRAMDLYLKIKEGRRLAAEDLELDDYEQFLNIWVSAKHDKPMQWVDLPPEDRAIYYRYVYILAQNHYLKKDKSKTNNLLGELPIDYPLRQLLELSKLYDEGRYGEVKQKFAAIQSKSERKQIKYYRLPEFDMVIINMMKLLAKAAAKLEGSEDVAELDESITLLRYNANIVNTEGNGMPFYYLEIPFQELMMSLQLRAALC